MAGLDSTIPYLGITVLQVLLFIVFLAIGVVVVRVVAGMVRRAMLRAKAPGLVADLVSSLVKAIGYIVVVLAVLPTLGIDTGAAALGLSAILAFVIGFGLQDTWANMAAGIWLAVIRPMDKGDFVEVAGYKGVVQGIGVMSTVLKTFDNAVITIPNRSIWGSPMVNYTREPVRRVSVSIGVAYGTDLDKAVNTALEIIRSHELVLSEPEPQVVITQLADSSINLEARAWVKKEHYGTVSNDLKKMLYEGFTREGIEIPFPQLDVHIRDMPR